MHGEVISGVASLTIQSSCANILVYIDCENNEFLRRLLNIIIVISVSSIPAGGPIVDTFFSTVPGLNLNCV